MTNQRPKCNDHELSTRGDVVQQLATNMTNMEAKLTAKMDHLIAVMSASMAAQPAAQAAVAGITQQPIQAAPPAATAAAHFPGSEIFAECEEGGMTAARRRASDAADGRPYNAAC